MAIELAVFDMAGTTVDDQGAVNRCFRATLAGHGLAVRADAVDAVMGLPKPEALRILVGRSALADALLGRVDAMHAEFVARMVEFYAHDPSVREAPGASVLFAMLKEAGVKVGLDTGFCREIADVILERLAWTSPDLVDATVASDEVANGRPMPDMIENLMGRLGVSNPRSVVKVGDAPADLEEGFAARCRWVVGVTWGTHSRAQLEKCAHTHLVDTMAELTELFRSGIAGRGGSFTASFS